jgi:hypothetical protein
MKGGKRTKEHLKNETDALRKRIAELEKQQSERSRSEAAAREARIYAEAIIDTVRV